MAIKAISAGRWWSRFHFLIRFAGLTGLLCSGIGAAWSYLDGTLEKVVSSNGFSSWNSVEFHWDYVWDTVIQGNGDLETRVAVGFLVGGAALAVIALLIEALAALVLVAGRRSAFGFNAVVQIGLATALLIGVNLFSYWHYVLNDWTTGHLFTLEDKTQQDLTQLTGETMIVVHLPRSVGPLERRQRHKAAGELKDKPDAYDFAAERKVVEKVKDLVEQFREFGPQFKVEVLDVEEEGYNKRLEELTSRGVQELRDALARAPVAQKDELLRKLDERIQGLKDLRQAIDNAPENSIFFYANGKVQRLSFNEFYKLDKADSKKADNGRGNLVLLYQGERSFVRKILNLYEKHPKVGVLVIHELLTTQGPEDYGLAGFKESLEARGFEVKDIILKKFSEFAPPEPAVFTYEESKVERVEEELAEVEAGIKNLEAGVKQLSEDQKLWENSTLDELSKKYADELAQAKIKKITESMRQAQLQKEIRPKLAFVKLLLKQSKENRDELLKEKAGLNVDKAAEERRITDLKTKLDRALADCDLLFIPRMTLRNVVMGDRISSRFYHLDEAQVNAVKDFLAAGKPVLACFGPTNEPASDAMRMAQLGPAGPDELENLLGRLGIKFGKQTILFNSESKSFAERRSGILLGGAIVEVPPVELDEAPRPLRLATERATVVHKPNPIRDSLLIAAHGRGEKTLDLHVRHPRPIYFEPHDGKEPAFSPEFMITSAASWNEDQPFPSREHTPRFEMPKPDDPTRGTLDEKRHGPFPIGVAAEVPIPADWYTDKKANQVKVRQFTEQIVKAMSKGSKGSEGQGEGKKGTGDGEGKGEGKGPGTVRVAAIGSGGIFTGQELSPAKEELLLDTCNWLLGRDELLPRGNDSRSYPRVSLSATEYNVWRWGTWLGLPLLFAYLGLVVLMIRRLR